MLGRKKKPEDHITDEMKKTFGKAQMTGVTFTRDKLPYLKSLLEQYREATELERKRRHHDSKLEFLLEPVATELSKFFQNSYKKEDAKWDYPDVGQTRHILANYAGYLLKKLQELKEGGWDGEGLQHDDYADSYRASAVRQLEMVITGLEAGGGELTLNIPADLAGQYHVWLISSIEYAIQKNEGPAAIKK